MERKESLLERASQILDIPGDALAGYFRLELLGDREVRMWQHRGILAYGSEEIHISAGNMTVRVKGEGLELRSMNPEELLITGHICALDLV